MFGLIHPSAVYCSTDNEYRHILTQNHPYIFMILDNFQKIKPLLRFSEERDLYYFIQIMQREKDGNPVRGQKFVRSYYIDNEEDFFGKARESIMTHCHDNNARAYIKLNVCSYRHSALRSLGLISEMILNGNERGIRHLMESVSGKYNARGSEKLWVIDIDKEEGIDLRRKTDEACSFLREALPVCSDRVAAILDTVSGKHIISPPLQSLRHTPGRPLQGRGHQEGRPHDTVRRRQRQVTKPLHPPMTIHDLKEKGLIIYEYVKGSHLFGLQEEGSDLDIGGVFISPLEELTGLREHYTERVSDERNDTVYYELGRWVELLCKNDPNILESLFVPEDKILLRTPVIDLFLSRRDLFPSKAMARTFAKYAEGQIEKATGLGKKIYSPMTRRLDPLDFCFTFKGYGSRPLKDYLAAHCLLQKYCALVCVDRMPQIYALFYDFGAHFNFEGTSPAKREEVLRSFLEEDMPRGFTPSSLKEYLETVVPGRIARREWLGYGGIIGEDLSSNDVRTSSVPKGEVPLCFISYNRNAYTVHCKEYRQYMQWKENRNEKRFSDNVGKRYDGKNMMHCIRLLMVAKEFGESGRMVVDRTADRDMLLTIKHHGWDYDSILTLARTLKEEAIASIGSSSLPDTTDASLLESLLRKARNMAYGLG